MKVHVNDKNLNVLQKSATGNPHSTITLVFLHYFGGSSRAWSEVIKLLASERTCVAPDLSGFGDSDAPMNNYTVSDYADDISALVTTMDIKSYVLIGHSMGGKIALSLAARQPSGLQSLVLLAPSPPTPEPIADDERARLLTTYGDRRAAEKTVRKITARPLAATIFERTVEDYLQSSESAWRAWLEGGSREDISAKMGRINVPVIIAAGGMDESLTEELLRREVVRRIAGARLTVLPEAGHLLPLEAPADTADLIDRHCSV